MTYAEWAANTSALGGVATAWPFSDQYNGLAAARFTSDRYAQVANAQQIDNTLPVRTNSASTYVYVLAAPEVQSTSAQTMSAWQRFLNAGFTFGDTAADALGLPSLDSVQRWIMYGTVAALALVAVFLILGARKVVKEVL